MTAYVVRSGAQKKKGILEKREDTLRHNIRVKTSEEKIATAAEAVRSSQLAVIKCLRHETEVCRVEDEERYRSFHETLDTQSQYWLEISVLDIAELYRDRDTE